MIDCPRTLRGVHRGVMCLGLIGAALGFGGAPAGARHTSPRGSRASHGKTDARHAPPCEGTARRVRAGRVRVSFSCDDDVTWFEIRADRALRAFEEPDAAFGCERATSRSFRCEDIHSGAGPEGGGIVTVSEPLCRRGSRLVLRVTPALNFERPTGAGFTLKGPC